MVVGVDGKPVAGAVTAGASCSEGASTALRSSWNGRDFEVKPTVSDALASVSHESGKIKQAKSEIVQLDSNTPPVSRTQIGQQLYLFQDQSGQPAEELIITSHGGFHEDGKHAEGMLSIPESTRIVFYNPHESILNDPGLFTATRGYTKVYEVLTAEDKKAPNYSLSKYEKDTYSSISAAIYSNRQMIEDHNTLIKNAEEKGGIYKKGSSVKSVGHFRLR